MIQDLSLQRVIAQCVVNSQSLALDRFAHTIASEAAHEMIRRGRKNLALMGKMPDVIYKHLSASYVPKGRSSPGLVTPVLGHCATRTMRRNTREPGDIATPTANECGVLRGLHAGASSGCKRARQLPV
ncbi:MAG: hypothetical protein MUP90_07325 [Gammaproteobacteria bacterium]|nr:hypothetical protein [Gammaproteobacteria bacterium]